MTFKRTEQKSALKEYKIICPVTVSIVYQTAETPVNGERPPKPPASKKKGKKEAAAKKPEP